ncbi:MAG: sulfite exporter TauE/SafE family protein [Moraxella sp.]|nr:sulfite exporter TauE/SafE family protein [Moraxella sp.]
MTSSSNSDYAVLVAVFIVAAVLHGISGTGYSLITIGGLSAYYSLADSVVLVLIPTAILNLTAWLVGGGTFWHNFTFYIKEYWLLIVLSFLGSVLGAYLLLWVNQHYLLLLLSAILVWYVGSAVFGKQIRLPNTKKSLAVMGVAGGIAGGATNAMSPILMMYLLSISDDKNTLIKVSNACFFMGKVAQAIVLFPAFVAMQSETWTLLGMATALSLVFVFVGLWLGRFLPKQYFRTLILVILTVLAIKLGYGSIMTLWG